MSDNSVFLSYRREVSNNLAALLCALLQKRGIDVFYDEAIGSGQFEEIILREIRDRPYFVLLLEDGTLDRCVTPSDWVRREVKQAIDSGRTLVAVVFAEFDHTDIERFLPRLMGAKLRSYNWWEWPQRHQDYLMGLFVDQYLPPVQQRRRPEASAGAGAKPSPTARSTNAAASGATGSHRSGRGAAAGPRVAHGSRGPRASGPGATQPPGAMEGSGRRTRGSSDRFEPLPVFRATSAELSLADWNLLTSQAELLLEELYVHVSTESRIDVIRRVRALRARLPSLNERQRHEELLEIFSDLEDPEAAYLLPAPYTDRIAFLPFLVEEYWEGDERRNLVTKVHGDVPDRRFIPGVTVVSWNGIPIERAIELSAGRQVGGTVEGRRVRALEALTLRPIGLSRMPDEDWVDVNYLAADGVTREVRFAWRVFKPSKSPWDLDVTNPNSSAAFRVSIDARSDVVRRAKKELFSGIGTTVERAATGKARQRASSERESTLPDVFLSNVVEMPGGPYGHVRILTFAVEDADVFVDEFVRIVGSLPANGLLVDVRGNAGGLLTAAERLLQILTPQPIEPTRVSFRCTPLTLNATRAKSWLQPWSTSIEEAVESGGTYSRPLPLLGRAAYNDVGQRYQGPVVLITDQFCDAAACVLAAGFQDNEIGPVISTGEAATGGCNTWDHAILSGADERIVPLPEGASFRVPATRITRAGLNAGAQLEEYGVIPDVLHRTTRRDLLVANVDLLKAGWALLQASRRELLSADVDTASGVPALHLQSSGLDRVDIWVDGRPYGSVDAPAVTAVKVPAHAAEVRLDGFAEGILKVKHHVRLSDIEP